MKATLSERYQAANVEAARVVLADARRYGGDDSLMVRWALATLDKAQPTVNGPLFRKAA